ncbi:MAG: DUF2958 domain-containing protein [Acidobacteria bacterium]|nr:DUF2958 domain-containing protein [Acidobacteriota bacterium]
MNELLPDDLRNSLPRLYTQQDVSDPIVHAKFFFPGCAWTWLVTEGQPEGDDLTFFGYVIGFEAEWGYFTLQELESVNVRGLLIERDVYFEPCKLSRCLSDLNSQGLCPSKPGVG